MDWRGRRESSNVEDRRGMPVGRTAVGGGIGAVVLGLVYFFFTGDPTPLMQSVPQVAQQAQAPDRAAQPYQESAGEAEMRQFVSTVLAETEDVWKTQFQTLGGRYEEPKLVLYSGQTNTACGLGESAMGPFYCPGDRNVFLDMAFFEEMRTKLGAGGDFAYAYVIAHEVGHHVQNLLGLSGKVHELQQRADEREANALSVRLELQADCFAGVWANRMEARQRTLEPGDVEEALGAASAVGDDRLQKQARGYVVPDSFTHGSSAQRMRWFQAGFTSGKMDACDTFGTRKL